MILEYSGDAYTREDLANVVNSIREAHLETTFDVGSRLANAYRPVNISYVDEIVPRRLYRKEGEVFVEVIQDVTVRREVVTPMAPVMPAVPIMETLRISPTCELLSGGIIRISGDDSFDWSAIRSSVELALGLS